MSNIIFSTRDITLANGANQEDNLLTSLQAEFIKDSITTGSIIINFIDTPGS